MPLVSICIPTYNRKDYLTETLGSVFAQTYKDYEIVIVDDGSTDGTEQMVKEAGWPVRYYWQGNAGDAAARNKLVEFASGEYIAFIDSDDLLMPDALERMIGAANKENEPVVVYGPYLRIDQNGSVIGKSKRKLHSGFITEHLFQDILIHSCGCLLPRQAIQDAGGFDQSLAVCSDYDLWLRLSLKYRFIALPEPTFKRRRHSGNISARSFANRQTELNVLENFYYNSGGKDVIGRRAAMKRLSQEGYRAARLALREGFEETAKQLLDESLRRYPNIKTLSMQAVVMLKEHLRC